jgi:hypothetical protein
MRVIDETIADLVIQYEFVADLGGHNTNRFPLFAGPLIAFERTLLP